MDVDSRRGSLSDTFRFAGQIAGIEILVERHAWSGVFVGEALRLDHPGHRGINPLLQVRFLKLVERTIRFAMFGWLYFDRPYFSLRLMPSSC